jgi:hypothetical protein
MDKIGGTWVLSERSPTRGGCIEKQYQASARFRRLPRLAATTSSSTAIGQAIPSWRSKDWLKTKCRKNIRRMEARLSPVNPHGEDDGSFYRPKGTRQATFERLWEEHWTATRMCSRAPCYASSPA